MAPVGNTSNDANMIEKRKKKVIDQIKNLQTYLGSFQDEDTNDISVVNQALTT